MAQSHEPASCPAGSGARAGVDAPSAAASGASLGVHESWRQALFNRRMLTCIFIGFSSGLPLSGSSKRPRAVPRTFATTCGSCSDEDIVYWYHGIDVDGRREEKFLASEFGDDYDAIPVYEQIYALAGPIADLPASPATRGSSRHRNDRRPVRPLLPRPERGGYFSHIDPVTLDPRAESLGHNRARKNWNSVGDHAPGVSDQPVPRHRRAAVRRLARRHRSTRSPTHFPDYDNSPFVQEQFHEDWSPDQSWGWQQNRAVVGHNLKIAWNLMRMNSLSPRTTYVDLAAEDRRADAGRRQGPAARRLVRRGRARADAGRASGTGSCGTTARRGGSRSRAILAYLILYGPLGDDRVPAAGARVGRVLQRVLPRSRRRRRLLQRAGQRPAVPAGHRADKGSHSMSVYHR